MMLRSYTAMFDRRTTPRHLVAVEKTTVDEYHTADHCHSVNVSNDLISELIPRPKRMYLFTQVKVTCRKQASAGR